MTLAGMADWVRWRRVFESEAKTLGLWDLFTGEQPFLSNPDPFDYYKAPRFELVGTETQRSVTAAKRYLLKFKGEDRVQTSEEDGQDKCPTEIEFQISVQDYKAARHEYERQCDRIIEARKFLCDRVSPELRSDVLGLENPTLALQALQSLFACTTGRGVDKISEQRAKLKLSDCRSLTHYLATVCEYDADIRSAGGEITASQFHYKIMSDLDPELTKVIEPPTMSDERRPQGYINKIRHRLHMAQYLEEKKGKIPEDKRSETPIEFPHRRAPALKDATNNKNPLG